MLAGKELQSRLPEYPHALFSTSRGKPEKPAVGGTKPENQRIVKTTTTVKTNAKHTKNEKYKNIKNEKNTQQYVDL